MRCLFCLPLWLTCLLQGLPQTRGEIVLDGIDPTIFNFVTDLAAELSSALAVIFLGSLYTIFLSLYLRRGNSIPIASLGEAPHSILDTLARGNVLRWPAWLVVFAGIVLVTRFSHAVADLGLGFQRVVREGPPRPVITLDPEQRNKQIMFQATGDPFLGENAIAVDGTFSANLETLTDLRLPISLSLGFLAAIDGIARGESHMLSKESALIQVGFVNDEIDTDRGQIVVGQDENMSYLVGKGDSFLAGLDYAIALPCQGMLKVEQAFGHPDFENTQIFTTAQIPNCDFVALRESGIYDQQVRRAEVTGYMEARNTAAMITNPTQTPAVALVHQGEIVVHFQVKKEYRALSRERDDWQKGREIFGFEALQIGTDRIPLGRVVLANGGEGGASINVDVVTVTLVRNTHYLLVGEVIGECPLDPLGQQRNSCFTVVHLTCDTFPEDYFSPAIDQALGGQTPTGEDLLPDSSPCIVLSADVVWGSYLDADAGLISAIAGIYGRTFKTVNDPVQRQLFAMNVALAAMFSLGTIDELPSGDELVRPTINWVFVVFMLLPLLLGLLSTLYVCAMKEYKMHLPTSPWENIILGTEIDFSLLPPGRMDTLEKFPKENNKLHFGFISGGPNPVVAERASFGSGMAKNHPTLSASNSPSPDTGDQGVAPPQMHRPSHQSHKTVPSENPSGNDEYSYTC